MVTLECCFVETKDIMNLESPSPVVLKPWPTRLWLWFKAISMLPPLFVFTGFTGIETGWRCGDVWKMRRKRKLKLSGLYSKTVQLGGVKAPTQTEEQMDFLCARGGYPFDRFFLVCHSCPDVEYQISSNKMTMKSLLELSLKKNNHASGAIIQSDYSFLMCFPLLCSCASSETDKDAGSFGSKVRFPGDRKWISFHRQIDCIFRAFISVAKSWWNDSRWQMKHMAHIWASFLYGSSWPNSAGRLLKHIKCIRVPPQSGPFSLILATTMMSIQNKSKSAWDTVTIVHCLDESVIHQVCICTPVI